MPSFMLPSGGGPSKVTTENMTASNIKTGVTIIVKYRGKDLYKVLGTFTNDANAASADILNTKTAYVNGSKVTGNMPNIGAVSQSLAINGTYNVPKGYHNGSGRITQSIPTQGAQTITPNTGDQRVTAGRYLTGDITVRGDGNLVAGNIKAGVSIFGVWGNLSASSATKPFYVWSSNGTIGNGMGRLIGMMSYMSIESGYSLTAHSYDYINTIFSNPIDLTNFSTINFKLAGFDGYWYDGYYVRVGVAAGPYNGFSAVASLSTRVDGTIASADVGSLKGLYYIRAEKYNYWTGGIREIWLN